MAVRDDFTAGEVLAAADLNDTFASKIPFAYGTATPTTTVEGFVFYDENVTPPAPKFWDGAAFQAFGGGKILQIVRATNTTLRSTTSTSYTDITGLSVTITPTKNTSAILLILTSAIDTSWSTGDNGVAFVIITDSSNVGISGAQDCAVIGTFNLSGISGRTNNIYLTQVAYATPATTSAVTYKVRAKVSSANTTLQFTNNFTTGQLFAIEVSA